MVRKRGRGRGPLTGMKRRLSRTYEDSDEIESDIDLDLESPPASPDGGKRYGLRQRTNKPILTDYYYDDDDETIPTKNTSDEDQDYNVAEDIQEETIRVAEKVLNSNHTKRDRRNSTRVPSHIEVSPEPEEGVRVIVEPHIQPREPTRQENHDGPVDFEEIIRADVVNKQKVEHVVHKKEVQVFEPLPLLKISKIQKVKPATGRRRGRRAREAHYEPMYHVTADCSINSVNNIFTNGDSNDEKMEVQLDPLEMLQTEYLDDPRGNKPKENGVTTNSEEKSKEKSETVDNHKPNGVKVPITIKPMDLPEAQKPPDLDPKEKEVILSNEYLLANAFDYSAEEFVKKQEEDKNKPVVEEEPLIPQLIFDSDESDDDVIIIEKKPEIIVLDDDD